LAHVSAKACPGLDPGLAPDLIRDGYRLAAKNMRRAKFRGPIVAGVASVKANARRTAKTVPVPDVFAGSWYIDPHGIALIEPR
jgi:hypothetical protein